MPKMQNYLLGYGQRLVEDIKAPKRQRTKAHPYSFGEAQEKVLPLLLHTVDVLDDLPKAACPGDQGVILVSLHPSYIAKSFYPQELFNTVGVRAVGSRQREIEPKKWSQEEHPQSALTAEFFVAGERKRFREWAKTLNLWTAESIGADDLRKVEDVRPLAGQVRPISSKAKASKKTAPLLEVVLHASGLRDSFYILEGFEEYMKSLDIKVELARRIHAGGLCFLPVRAPVDTLPEVAKFSFLRAVREMPSLRQFQPVLKIAAKQKTFSCNLPNKGPLDPTIRVAVFDGGLPSNIDLKRWANQLTPSGVKASMSEYQEHGLAVTSALLFGPLEEGVECATPYARVDHYRVLDTATGDDPQDEYYDVLLRIKGTLEQKTYDFVNLSIGPDSPIEDDDVHSWTAVLDELLANGKTLACIPVGNNGEGDRTLGLARIQTPSDCVNAMSIGACDSYRGGWKRATYSCIGPGRSPGRMKPEAVAFGGTRDNPYYVLSAEKSEQAWPRIGTSLASPTALRTAIGVRAHLGPVVSPLALKALLIHRCEAIDEHDPMEAGWGRIRVSVEDIVTCEEGTAHIVYQGMLDPASWIRARVPVPATPMRGKVYLGATICFATPTDPQDPFNYTRSGLDVIFRPHSKQFKKKGTYADPKPFFRRDDGYVTESEMRGAFKWDTTISAFHGFLAPSLNDPVFDIHYNARLAGHRTAQAKSIPYALIVTVRSHHLPDLYNRVLHRYRNYLEILRPVIQIPVRT